MTTASDIYQFGLIVQQFWLPAQTGPGTLRSSRWLWPATGQTNILQRPNWRRTCAPWRRIRPYAPCPIAARFRRPAHPAQSDSCDSGFDGSCLVWLAGAYQLRFMPAKSKNSAMSLWRQWTAPNEAAQCCSICSAGPIRWNWMQPDRSLRNAQTAGYSAGGCTSRICRKIPSWSPISLAGRRARTRGPTICPAHKYWRQEAAEMLRRKSGLQCSSYVSALAYPGYLQTLGDDKAGGRRTVGSGNVACLALSNHRTGTCSTHCWSLHGAMRASGMLQRGLFTRAMSLAKQLGQMSGPG